jgi:TrmH family RNA methyltransferase
MPAAPISSRANPLVQRTRRIGSEASARRETGCLLAEGIRLVEEALDAGAGIEKIFVSPRLIVTERGRALLHRVEKNRALLVETTDGVMDAIVDAETSQGVLAVVRAPGSDRIPDEGPDPAFWVVGWGLQDPGNLGTLLRTADAAGADLFLTVPGTADVTAPKAVRASAGSVFRLPLARAVAPDDLLDAAQARGVRLYGTDPSEGTPYDEPSYEGSIGFVFGREGEGLPPAVRERLDRTVTIPMRPGVESLNVAAAAAVVLFEAARRRRRGRPGARPRPAPRAEPPEGSRR